MALGGSTGQDAQWLVPPVREAQSLPMAGSPPEPSWEEGCSVGLGEGSLSWPASPSRTAHLAQTLLKAGVGGRAGIDGLRGAGGDWIPSEPHLDSQGLECPRPRRCCYVEAGH